MKRHRLIIGLKPAGDADVTGVCIRVEAPAIHSDHVLGEDLGDPAVAADASVGLFRVFPYTNTQLVPFLEGVRKLNVEVAVKLRSASIHAALARVPKEDKWVVVDRDTRIQILDRVEELGGAEREGGGAFIVGVF